MEELKKVNPKGNHSYMNLNVVNEPEWEAAMKKIEKAYGRLDVLVNVGWSRHPLPNQPSDYVLMCSEITDAIF